MRPLKLELEGFSVYKERQSIDFSRLSFFVIQGKTGAGKTSIVDAITFALYGRVPRYGTQKAHRMVLSKGSERMRVSLDFSVGGKEYRVERFYRLKPEDYTIRVYENGKRLDIGKAQVDRWVEKVTGLDYRTFTRVILLPQGEFDRFLKPSSPRERREILINLLDLEVFERARKIAAEKYKHLLGKKEVLQQEMAGLEEVDADRVDELEGEKKGVQKEIKKTEEEIRRLEELLRKGEERLKLEKDLEEVSRRLKVLEERGDEIKDLEERVKRSEKTAPYLPYLEQLERIGISLGETRLTKERLIKERLKVGEELRTLTERVKEAERKAKKLPELRKELEETVVILEKVRSALEDFRQSAEKKRMAESIRRKLREREKDLEDLGERVKRGERFIEEIKEALEALDFDEDKYLEMVRLSRERERALKKKRELKETRKRLEEVRDRLKGVAEKLTELSEELKVKEEALSKAGISFHAHSVRELLKKGDTCPVCGNIYEEPPPLERGEDYVKLKGEVDRIRNRVLELEKIRSGLEKEELMLTEEIKTVEKEIGELNEILEEDFEGRLEDLERKRKEKRSLEEKLKKYQEALAKRKEEHSSIKVEIEKMRTQMESLERESRELSEKVKGIKSLLIPGEGLREAEKRLDQKREDLKNIIESSERELEEARRSEEKKRQELVRIETSLKEVEKNLQDLENSEKTILQKLTPLFKEFRDLEEVKETALSPEELEDMKRKIEDYRIEMENLKSKEKEIKEALRDTGPVEKLEEVKKKHAEEKNRLEELLKKSGEIDQEIRQVRSLLERKKEIKKQLSEIEKKLRIYEVLKEDLKSDRLQDFVSSLMLSRIVERAGEYLMSFTGNYEFLLDERGEMVVVDRAQGVERSVSSLSGGETFLASLSLALGVSDILSANAHLESLFIDEGFGSLDEETRERVSDMLELIKQKIRRMVGIISHIPDLAERFHQRIQVVREESGSRIKVIY